mmetsp:Transcript_3707/g.13655  ORF Transcript_3707/g.13655 Transcript_3707/m.13655 type:complete len:317 (+) Transcript_3707:1-951(+)
MRVHAQRGGHARHGQRGHAAALLSRLERLLDSVHDGVGVAHVHGQHGGRTDVPCHPRVLAVVRRTLPRRAPAPQRVDEGRADGERVDGGGPQQRVAQPEQEAALRQERHPRLGRLVAHVADAVVLRKPLGRRRAVHRGDAHQVAVARVGDGAQHGCGGGEVVRSLAPHDALPLLARCRRLQRSRRRLRAQAQVAVHAARVAEGREYVAGRQLPAVSRAAVLLLTAEEVEYEGARQRIRRPQERARHPAGPERRERVHEQQRVPIARAAAGRVAQPFGLGKEVGVGGGDVDVDAHVPQRVRQAPPHRQLARWPALAR